MKRASILLTALLLASCSPQVYPLYLEVRQASSSGFNLSRKSMSIVYMDGYNTVDSLFDRSAASAMARKLEEDYFGGAEQVALYHIPSADTLSLDRMHELVMDTDKDVVFVLSSHLDASLPDGQPVQTRLHVYDSMGEDRVVVYSGHAVLPVNEQSTIEIQAEEVGERISRRFLSNWTTERFSFYYFDGLSDDWDDALTLVEKGQFAKAADEWMSLVNRGSAEKRACAAYNLAMAFYLMEDYEMSERWLDHADKLENLSLSPGLRRRLNGRK